MKFPVLLRSLPKWQTINIKIHAPFRTHLHAILEEVRLEVVDESGRGLPAVHHPGQAVLAVLKFEVS